MRRLLLLPAAFLALSLSACDSGSLVPTGDGMQSNTNVPTANVGVDIHGPDALGVACSSVYYADTTIPGHFVIASGPGTVWVTSNLGNRYATDVTRTGATTTIVLELRANSDDSWLGTKNIVAGEEDCE